MANTNVKQFKLNCTIKSTDLMYLTNAEIPNNILFILSSECIFTQSMRLSQTQGNDIDKIQDLQKICSRCLAQYS